MHSSGSGTCEWVASPPVLSLVFDRHELHGVDRDVAIGIRIGNDHRALLAGIETEDAKGAGDAVHQGVLPFVDGQCLFTVGADDGDRHVGRAIAIGHVDQPDLIAPGDGQIGREACRLMTLVPCCRRDDKHRRPAAAEASFLPRRP